MSGPKIFATIRKVDEEKRMVFGRIAQEEVDKSGEIMDYAKSKPYFESWSAEIAKDTDGKSLGNVRAMHGKVAAGVLKAIDFNDTDMAIDVSAHVVDDQEWKKVLAGVYTGFSIGGAYVGDKTVEKVNGVDVKRYTAKPSEVSLVDRPCIPSAKFFEVQKADGTTAQVEFQEPQSEEPATYEVNGTDEDVGALAKLLIDHRLPLGDVNKFLGEVLAASGGALKIEKRPDVDPKEGEKSYGDVEFADEKNKKYPIDTAEHVRAAASYFGKAKNREKYDEADQKKIDAKIAAAKKKFDIGDGAEKLSKGDIAVLRKDMYSCSSLSNVIHQLISLKQSAAYEAYVEGDDEGAIAKRFSALISAAGQLFKDMIDEIITENADGTEAPADMVTLAEQCGEMAKYEGDALITLVKIGARNSAADKDRIAAIHNAAVELGAECHAEKLAKGEPAGDLKKLVEEALAPMQKALTEANEKIAKLEAQPVAPTVRLRAVAKSQDDNHPDKPDTNSVLNPQPIVDANGDKHTAAGLIKSLHQIGGVPFTKGNA